MSKIALIFKFRVGVFVVKFLILDFNYILVKGITIIDEFRCAYSVFCQIIRICILIHFFFTRNAFDEKECKYRKNSAQRTILNTKF